MKSQYLQPSAVSCQRWSVTCKPLFKSRFTALVTSALSTGYEYSNSAYRMPQHLSSLPALPWLICKWRKTLHSLSLVQTRLGLWHLLHPGRHQWHIIFKSEIQLKSDSSCSQKNIFRLSLPLRKKHKITFRCTISGALRDASAATATTSFLPKNAIKTAGLKEENHLHWHTEVAEAMS